jgi:hypothetical protein
MQNMPGHDNGIAHSEQERMTNWWTLVADWDGAIEAGQGLHEPVPYSQPVNDDFANAIALVGAAGSTTGTNRGATREDLVDTPHEVASGRSVWWRWTAPFDGILRVDTLGSSFDTVLVVYRLDEAGRLVELAFNDDFLDLGVVSGAEIPVDVSGEYYLAVDSFGPGDGDGVAGDIQLSWLATSAVVVASDYQAPNVPWNVIDGVLETRWSAEGDGQWLQLDLGSAGAVVDSIAIAWFKGDERVASFHVEVSMDGSTWIEVYRGESSGMALGIEAYAFTEVSARYVRIVGHGTTQSDWNSITQVRVTSRALVRFLRGDCQLDGAVDLTDVVASLEYAFLGRVTPSCLAACDFNADGGIDVTNAMYLLGALFLGGPPPAAPFPECGDAPGDEVLECAVPPAACF